MQVAIVDVDGKPLPGVSVEVLPNAGEPQSRVTGSDGALSLQLGSAGTFELAIRRIGFFSTRRVLKLSGSDQRLVVVLGRIPATLLDAVRVTATAPLALDKFPVLDSLEIAARRGGSIDIIELVRKLRPDAGYQHYRCPRGDIRFYLNERFLPDPRILRRVRLEDIEEARYVNCFDPSIPVNDRPHEARFYIALKRGVSFDVSRGDYNVSEAADPKRSAAKTFTGPTYSVVVRVLDAGTNLPVVDAEVVDLKSKLIGRSNATGDVRLDVADSNLSLVNVRRTGYVPQTIVVRARELKGQPVLVKLTLRGPALVSPYTLSVQTGSKPIEDLSKLRSAGFYDRESTVTGGARFWAGVIDPKLVQICSSDIWIDGAPTRRDLVSSARLLADLLESGVIVGIETYDDAAGQGLPFSVPSEPQTGLPERSVCRTLIWTR